MRLLTSHVPSAWSWEQRDRRHARRTAPIHRTRIATTLSQRHACHISQGAEVFFTLSTCTSTLSAGPSGIHAVVLPIHGVGFLTHCHVPPAQLPFGRLGFTEQCGTQYHVRPKPL